LLLEYIFASTQYNHNYTLQVGELFGLTYLARINWHAYKTCSTDPSPCKT